MKVVCCIMYSPSHKELANIAIRNLQEYCRTHGYIEYYIDYIEDGKWEYEKHKAFKKLFEYGYDLIWYRDVDSLVTNMTIPITDFIDYHYSFYITKDFNELNGGSVIIKNDKHGSEFNKIVLEAKPSFENEQNFYNAVIDDMYFSNKIKVLPHPSINSYRYDLYPECKEYVGKEDLGDWKEGNFVLHVPALPLEKRAEVLRVAKIIR